MKRILRGNDVIIKWTVKQLTNIVPEIVDFTGKTVKVYVCDSYGNHPAEFTIVDNVINIHLSGSIQNNGAINLDCYWQDITSYVCNRTKLNNVIEFVDNPALVDLTDVTNDLDVLTVNFTSDAFFGGNYTANFSNYYTKAETDSKYSNDYSKLINKPFSVIDNIAVTELPVLIKNDLIIGTYAQNKSGAIITGSGDAEFDSITVRTDINVSGKILINGVEIGKSSGTVNTAILDNRYVLKSVWDTLFEVDANGKLKIKVDAYSLGGLSALGVNNVSGGSTSGLDYDLLQTLLTGDVNAYPINAAFLTNIDANYITSKLNNTYSLANHTHNISELTGISAYATTNYVDTAIANSGFLKESVFNSVFEIITDEAGNKTIRIKGSAYADNGLSALGNGTTSGSISGLDYDSLHNLLINSENAFAINTAFLTNIDSLYITGKLGNTYSTTAQLNAAIDLINTKWTTDVNKITNWDAAYSWGNHALAGYLAKATFDDLFEKENIGTVEAPVYVIKAKYSFYSIGGVSALGNGLVGGGSAGLDYNALQVLLTSSENSYTINSAFLGAIDKAYITGKLGTEYSLSTHGHNLSTLNNDAGFIYGTDSRLSDARVASDVYAWAKASVKPSYEFSEIGSKPSTLAGYGITDAIGKDGGTINGHLTVTGDGVFANAKFNKTLIYSPDVPNDLLNMRRYGENHTILNIMAPPQTSWGKSREATLSLVRGDGNEYFIDLYNMDYGSVDAGNNLDYGDPVMGMRLQKRATGKYVSFSFEYGDGINVLQALKLHPNNSSESTNKTSVEVVNDLLVGGKAQIGGIQLIYDATNNALYVQKADGSSANFYATGGIAALGYSGIVGGNSGLDYTALQSLLTGSENAYNINLAFLGNINQSYITNTLAGTYALSGHVHNFADIANKPDSLIGYGIIDAARASNAKYDDFNAYTDKSDITSILANNPTNAHAPINDNATWWNLINIRHRGGLEDGNVWGSQITFGMNAYTNRMFFRNHVGGTWESWKEIYHSANSNLSTVDWTVHNLYANSEIYLNNKVAIQGGDTWLRLNNGNAFTDGIYCGTGILRTDGEFQVGGSGSKFKVDASSGRVGINITNPSQMLDVNGNALIHNTLYIGANWGTTITSDNEYFAYYCGHYGIGFSTNQLNVGALSGEKMRLTAGGNLLIGTSIDNGYKLDVVGTGRFTDTLNVPSLRLGDNFITITSSYLSLQSRGNELRIGGSTKMYINDGVAPGGTPTAWYWEKGASGTYADFYIGSLITSGSINTDSFIQIGSARLIYDTTNNAIYVQKADGTAANFYATGGVSALGYSGIVGGASGMDYAALQTLLTGSENAYAINTAFLGNINYSYLTNILNSKYSDINHTHSFAALTDKPNTLTGYGIYDAASIGHTHGLLKSDLYAPAYIDGLTASNFRTTLFGNANAGYNISTARWSTAPTILSNLGLDNYGTAIAWSGSDTHGFIALNFAGEGAVIGGGYADNITWSAKLWTSGNFNPDNKANTSGTYSGLSVGYATNANNSDLLDNLHSSAFSQEFNYNTTNLNTGYYKINILPTGDWMLSFTLRVYQNYQYYDILISGYNYASGGNNWYSPKATLIASSIDNITVKFGYDSAANLWIAIPASSYTALKICNINNGYAQVNDWSNKFSISNVSTLTGTIQTEIIAKRPLRYDETAITANYSTSAGNADTIDGYHASSFVLTSDYRLTNARYNPYALTFTGYASAVYDGSNAVTVALPTKVSQLTNDSGYLTAITKAQVEGVLTGTVTSHVHNFNDLNNLIVAGNEHNWIPNGYSGAIWFNYQDIINRDSTALISEYAFGNGRGGYSLIRTAGYAIAGYNNDYVILAGGGSAPINSLNVNNAATATKLATARTISITGVVTGSGSFDGSGNLAINTSISADSIALGTNTVGNYAKSVGVSGNGLSITGTAGEGIDFIVNSNATNLNTASTLVFRDANGNFSAGSITAALIGNASTATTLQNTRTLWGQSFNGSANVTGALSSVTDVTMTGTLNIGSAQFIYDSITNTIRVQKSDGSAIGFYSTGEVASYGVGSNGGTSYINAVLNVSNDIYTGGNVYLNNEMYLRGKSTTGTYYQLFGVDSSNYVKYGDIGLTSIFKGAGILMSTASKTNIITVFDTIGLNANTSITGTITSTGSGTFNGGSFTSIRELKDIHSDWQGSALNAINEFKVRDFNYKNDITNRTLGFIIDEIPNSVSKYVLFGKDKDSINIYSLHALSFKAHQETKSEIDILKDRIIHLELEINQLRNQLNN